MDVLNVYKSFVNQLKEDEDVVTISLVGSASDLEEKYFYKLADIDLFVVKHGISNFVKEVVEYEGVNFEVSYIDVPALDKLIAKDNHHSIRLLAKSKKIFKRNEDATECFDKAREIFFEGPDQLSEEDITYYRFLLSNLYEDVENRITHEVEAEFLSNIFVHEVLKAYFKLNNSWVPRNKKLLTIVFEVDIILYELVKASLKEKDIERKIKICHDILVYVLRPYGGKLNKWEKSEFPI